MIPFLLEISNIFLSILGYPCFRKLPHWYPWLNKNTLYFWRAHCWSDPQSPHETTPREPPSRRLFFASCPRSHKNTTTPQNRCTPNATDEKATKRIWTQVSAKSAKKSASEQEAWRVMRVGLVGGSSWCFKKHDWWQAWLIWMVVGL